MRNGQQDLESSSFVAARPTVDTGSSTTCPCWITALDHKVGNDAVEDSAGIVAKGCSRLISYEDQFLGAF